MHEFCNDVHAAYMKLKVFQDQGMAGFVASADFTHRQERSLVHCCACQSW